jgi:hypothetical protein
MIYRGKKGFSMKLRKKIKKYTSLILALSIVIQPLFLQSQLIAIQKNYKEQITQENYMPKDSACYSNAKYYIDITPENLEGLNLKELFRAVIEYAYETNTVHELPQGVINSCKALENDASTLYMPDLAEALPIIIEKMADPMMQQMLLRAARIDAPGTDGAVVGPLLDCNVDKIVPLLNKLLQTIHECCAQLEFDFKGVFTVLSNLMASVTCDFSSVFSAITTNFNGTFSVLNDIQDTLTTCCAQLEFDFDGTFSVLAEIECDLSSVFSVITTNFNGTFTVLTDIQDTLTTCCAQLEFNFDGTFTVLANLVATATCDLTSIFSVVDTNFDGTFTVVTDIQNTLTTCCTQLEFNFDGTFTVLENLVATASCDFTSIFSVVNTNFNETFTVVTDIKNTLTTCCAQLEFDFDGTFTTLANLTCDLTPIFTVVSTNFGGTFTVVTDIKNTLTTCCAQLEFDFDGTFTTLANPVVTALCNFTPIFTALQDFKDTLTICCEQLEFDFDGTFSSLANLTVTFSCDFASIFTVLEDFKDTLTTCCNNFNGTFSALNDIKDTLTLCCEQLAFDFDGTFTVIASLLVAPPCDLKQIFTELNDIKNTLTACYTQLESDFDGTFTVIANVAVSVFIDLAAVFTTLADIKNSLTVCCAATQHNFDGTFTSLADIKNTVTAINFSETFTVLDVLTAAVCNPTVIRQSNFGVGGTTPLIISKPGVYIFGENITFNPAGAAQAITITTSAVVLDLQCFTLRQGNAIAGVDGIRVNSGLANVTLQNGMISNFTRAGISVQSNTRRIMIQDLTCLLCAVRGIELLGAIGNLIQDAEITNCIIDSCSQGATGDFAFLVQQSDRCEISYCDIRNCGAVGHTLSAVRLDTCNQSDLNSITIIDNTGSTFLGVQLLAPTRSSFKNCTIDSNAATANLTGIDITGAANSLNVFDNCQILSNTAGASFSGLSLAANTSNNLFVKCSINWNSSVLVNGFALTGGGATNNQNSFMDCVVNANSSTTNTCSGFLINGSDAGIIFRSIVSDNISTAAPSRAISTVGSGGNNWTIKENIIARNTGVNPANSFGIFNTVGANNLFLTNGSFSNGGVGALPGNQLTGVSGTAQVTPIAPATSNLSAATEYWTNLAVAA